MLRAVQVHSAWAVRMCPLRALWVCSPQAVWESSLGAVRASALWAVHASLLSCSGAFTTENKTSRSSGGCIYKSFLGVVDGDGSLFARCLHGPESCEWWVHVVVMSGH